MLGGRFTAKGALWGVDSRCRRSCSRRRLVVLRDEASSRMRASPSAIRPARAPSLLMHTVLLQLRDDMSDLGGPADGQGLDWSGHSAGEADEVLSTTHHCR